MNQKQSKPKKSRRPYRRYTVSIGDILDAKAKSGDKDAQLAASKMLDRYVMKYD